MKRASRNSWVMQESTNPVIHLPNKKGALTNQSAFGKNDRLLRAEDGVLGGFGHLELHHALGRNLNGFASRGIAALTGSAVLQLELAEAREREGVLGVL